jgi:hypothetical protein
METLHLFLKRFLLHENATIGVMYIEEEPFSFSLEDKIRNIKIAKETCIPEGLYKIEYTFSPRFKKYTLEIKNVFNFTGIRIHSGSFIEDTEGCLLLGYRVDIMNRSILDESKLAVNAFNDKIIRALDTMEVTIDIKNLIL